jgi:HAD superfamily hydrolase (TIGR01509 family)
MTGRAVLFDMDGTLVDSERMHYDATAAVLSAMGYAVPEGLAEMITGMSGADCHALLQRLAGFESSLEEYTRAKYRAYLETAPSLLMRSGAEAALALLGDIATPFAIVSNSDRILVDANLRAVGLQHPGLISVARNDVRRGKPDPESYLRAAYLLGVEPADCIVVEDSIPGAVAGHAAGMTVVGWPEPHRRDLVFPENTIIAGPHELKTTLAHCLAETPDISIPEDAPHVSR